MNKTILLTLLLLAFSFEIVAQNLTAFKNDNGKWGIQNEQKETVLEPKYDHIASFNNGVAKSFIGELSEYGEPKNGLYGLINENGSILFEPKYNFIGYFNNKMARVFIGALNLYGEPQKGLSGFIQKDGHVVISASYDNIGELNKAIVTACKDGKWGIIDTTENVLLEFKYDNISNPSNGFYKTFEGVLYEDGRPKQGLFGLADEKGTVVIEPKYNHIYDYRKTWARVYIGTTHDGCNPIEGKYGFIDKLGKEVIPLTYNRADNFSKLGLAKVCKEGKCGYIDSTETAIIPLKYDHITYLRKGLATTFMGTTDDLGNNLEGKYGVVDQSGKELAPPIYDAIGWKTEIYVVAKKDGKFGMLKNGEVLIPFEYDGLSGFKNGIAIIFKGTIDEEYGSPKGLFGLIDTDGKIVVKMKYDMLRSYYENMYIASKEGKYGVITQDKKTILKFNYDEILPIEEGNGEYIPRTRIGEKFGCIDMKAHEILEAKYDQIELNSYDMGIIAVTLDEKTGLFDLQGKEILPIMYDYINVYDENKFAVSLNDEEFTVDRNNKKIEE